MREKDRGIWQSYSWRECHGARARFRAGAGGGGLQARRQAVRARRQPRPPLLGAARRAGAGRHVRAALPGLRLPASWPTCSTTPRCRWSWPRTRSRSTRCSRSRGELPSLRLVVYEDPRGMSAYERPTSSSPSPSSRRLGAPSPRSIPAISSASWIRAAPTTSPLIAYTSGTTGRSKGVLLSHANMIATSESFAGVEPLQRGDNWLCYLPMGWVGDMIFSLGTSLVVGATCNCPESPETVQRDLRELGPSALPGAAAHLGEHADRPAGQGGRRLLAQAARLRIFPRASPSGASCSRATASRSRPTTRLGYRLGEFFVYGPVRDQLGLRNARWCLTGGAPLGADTFRFFRSFGVNLKQIYGATEACAPGRAAGRRRGRPQHGRPHRSRARRCASASAARCR